ncbi:MAG: hypothetical protein ACR2KJ_07095 [Jatrophihabitans sp.]
MTATPPAMTISLAHGTVGRLSDSVSMGVVEIRDADHVTVQFFDAPGSTELEVGQSIQHSGLTVTLIEAHLDADFRASRVSVEVTPEANTAPGSSGAES